jgi:hypothetical protein
MSNLFKTTGGRNRFVASLGVALIHVLVYLRLWGAAFGIAENHGIEPAVLIAALKILGFPVMLLLRLPPEVFALHGRWWGDDSNFIVGLAILNGVLWGYVLVWMVSKMMPVRK